MDVPVSSVGGRTAADAVGLESHLLPRVSIRNASLLNVSLLITANALLRKVQSRLVMELEKMTPFLMLELLPKFQACLL
jgi:hypothetical protein